MNRSPFATMPNDLRASMLRAIAETAPAASADTNAGRELLAAMLRDDGFAHAVAVEVERKGR